MPFEKAVADMTRRAPDNQDLKIFALSVIVQKETGGNLVEIIEKIADTVRGREKFQGKLRGLTAEGRMSSYILGALPFVSLLFMLVREPRLPDAAVRGAGRALRPRLRHLQLGHRVPVDAQDDQGEDVDAAARWSFTHDAGRRWRRLRRRARAGARGARALLGGKRDEVIERLERATSGGMDVAMGGAERERAPKPFARLAGILKPFARLVKPAEGEELSRIQQSLVHARLPQRERDRDPAGRQAAAAARRDHHPVADRLAPRDAAGVAAGDRDRVHHHRVRLLPARTCGCAARSRRGSSWSGMRCPTRWICWSPASRPVCRWTPR